MDYSEYQQTVIEKLTEYGADCKIIRKGNEEHYDEETNTYITDDEEIMGKAIQSTFDIRLVNGTTIQNGDIRFMAYFPKRPQNTDSIEFGGRTLKIVNVAPMNIDGVTDIYYDIQAR